MRTNFENKRLNLSLSEDQQAITTAERKVNAAKRQCDKTERELQRLRDGALFGRPAAADEIRLHEHQLREDHELVAQCERELQDAKDAPARREQEAKEAAAINRDMTILEQRIAAWFESGAPLMLEADDLIERVTRVGTVNT